MMPDNVQYSVPCPYYELSMLQYIRIIIINLSVARRAVLHTIEA